jgi:hypothetical protein
MWATSAISMKLPKENNHPLGDSPNLVILVVIVRLWNVNFEEIKKIIFFCQQALNSKTFWRQWSRRQTER